MEEARRRDKLDDSLLFVMGLVGIFFGVFQVFVRPATLLQFLIPAGLLAWVLPFYYGYVRGAVGDSLADRYRGWIFLILGSGLYAIMVAQEEVARFLLLKPNQEGIVVVPFLGLALLLFRQTRRLRKFVLGPKFSANPVLSRSAGDTVRVAIVIIFAGAFLAIVDSLSIWDLLIVGPLTPFAVFYGWRSEYYAARIYWPFAPAEKKGHLGNFGKIGRVSKILSNLTFAVYVGAGLLAVLIDLGVSWTVLSQSLLTLFFEVLGLATGLALPTLILYYLMRTTKDFDFEGPFPEKPQVNYPI